MQNFAEKMILIIDFGSQYTQLIARCVRELGVYAHIVDCECLPSEIMELNPAGIILSGGPESVALNATPRIDECIFDLGVPVLGICYGMQAMATQLGGKVARADSHEYGLAQLQVTTDSLLFANIEQRQLDVWMSHGDHVGELPTGFNSIAATRSIPHAAMADVSRSLYGLQFHPEVTHTPQGKTILANFVHTICGCAADWTPANIVDESIRAIQQQVGKDKVLVGLSGGVDSAVVAALLHRAIGDQLTCVFVDTGLLRKDEGDEVMQLFARHLGVKVIRVNAAERFYTALKGVSDPEEKRKRIGEQFIRVFEQQAELLMDVKWLGQGTIYPDVIESAKAKSGKTHVIKSHHNVGGLPKEMNLKLVEPLRELFKDEVRKVGEQLGLPHQMVYRHPFPGPGLGIRILGEVTPEYVGILQQADAIFIQELYAHNLYEQVSQAMAIFLPVKAVGVKGDQRCYEYVIALRAINSIDFMTASWSDFSHAFLSHVSHRIMNEVPQVARVVYDISGKPPATIEWE